VRLPFGMQITRARPAAPEQRTGYTITQNPSFEEWLAFSGQQGVALPSVTIRSAMRVPAFFCGVSFLTGTMATMTLEQFRSTPKGPVATTDLLSKLVRDAPNPEWSSYAARRYFWTQHFLRGRGLLAIIRQGGQPAELWPMNTAATMVTQNAWGEKTYTTTFNNGSNAMTQSYQSADVIDVPFHLNEDMVTVQSAVHIGEKALQLAQAMNDYGATFFAGGGVPPLALEGPLATGPDAMKRTLTDMSAAIDAARNSDTPIFPMPPSYKLSPVGFDPAKGQMTEAKKLQVLEIARVLELPPVFLQDLTFGTMANTEQQDLFVVKHRISHLASAFEQEANLKLYGQTNAKRYVRHDLDSMQRGDFLTRQDGLAKSVQGGIRTPQEARRFEGLPDHDNPAANDLFMQGATMPLGTLPNTGGGANDPGTTSN